MADHFFSINHGLANANNNFAITKGTSSTASDDIELRIADGVGLTRLDVIKALEQFENLFASDPSAAQGGTDFPVL